MRILTINSGSSSLKAALYEAAQGELRKQHAEEARALSGAGAHAVALAHLLDRWPRPEAVGHRLVVAGEDWPAARVLDRKALTELRALGASAPDHLPQALALIDAVDRRYPDRPQVGCSDSAFHHSLPAVARAIALPAQLLARAGPKGGRITRRGYHGLSCESALAALAAEDAAHARGRIIIAHLGNGCSLTALREGRSVETTMGYTPLGGVPMSTRSGDLDPGVVIEVLRRTSMPVESCNQILNHQSGLMALSEGSGDMQTLLQQQAQNPRAAFAVECFVYQVRKSIGSLIAALGGLDLLVFTGGIGEHAAEIRERICAGLGWLHFDQRVIAADEDARIASHTAAALRAS